MVLQDQTDEACLMVGEMTPRKKNLKKRPSVNVWGEQHGGRT